MARDAAHENFVHTLETFTAWVKSDSTLPVPNKQTVIHVEVADDKTVIEFAAAQGLDTPTYTSRGWYYVDVPFGAIIYRVASGSW